MHDVAEFLETGLGKRKLTYVGVTISAVCLWLSFFHNDFFKEKKNGEASHGAWGLVKYIVEWSEVLPDFGSSPLRIITTCFSLVVLPVCFAVLDVLPFFLAYYLDAE